MVTLGLHWEFGSSSRSRGSEGRSPVLTATPSCPALGSLDVSGLFLEDVRGRRLSPWSKWRSPVSAPYLGPYTPQSPLPKWVSNVNPVWSP